MNKILTISLMLLLLFCATIAQAQECSDDQDCIGFFFTEVEGNVGDVVCTDQYVCNFTDILSFQFAIQYDNQVLRFVECKSGALASYTCDGIVNKPEDGILNTLWFEQNAKIVTLEAGTVLSTLCFEIIGVPEDESFPLLQLSDQLSAEITLGDPNDPAVATSSSNVCSGGGPAMSSSCASSDSLSLVDLYNATEGPQWLIQWSLENPIQSWYGVTTNERSEIMELNLQNNNLKGELPASIAGLCQLTKLNLSKNRLSGVYPAEFEALCDVEVIDFSDNELGSFETFCGDLTSATYDVLEGKIEVYPNPVGDFLDILIGDGMSISSLQMYDLSGHKVLQIREVQSATTLDLSIIEPGIYILDMMSDEGDTYYSKIVKQ